MKKLPNEIVEKISDFEAESDLSLPGFALEKDYFVLDVITLIKALPPSQDFRFVFCGGTCLAKAYGILHRMSEDVDFKLVPTEATSQFAIEFKNQHPQFYLTPLVQLNDALIWAGESENLKNQYQSFVADMVYASPTDTPSFDEALYIFSRTMQTSLALLKAEDIAKSLETANKIN